MKSHLILGLFCASLFITGCKKDLEPQESSPEVTAQTPPATGAPQAAATPPMPGQPGQAGQAGQPSMTPTAIPPTANVAPGMNPAHGQPGHRCDIAVGAPLSSPPGNKAAPAKPAMTINPTQPTTSGTPALLKPNAAQATATAPGMNPPHGQAGHRCDVAVGAALPATPPPAQTIEAPKISATPAAPKSEFTVSEQQKK